MLHIIGTTPRKRISFYSSDPNITLKNSNWEVIFAVGRKHIVIKEGVFKSDNEIEVYVDTSKLQIGKLEAQLNVKVIDTDSPEGERMIKIVITNFDDYIVNGLPH